eukprot:jgi/Botrbrau1/18489/Bobra.0072s0069.1
MGKGKGEHSMTVALAVAACCMVAVLPVQAGASSEGPAPAALSGPHAEAHAETAPFEFKISASVGAPPAKFFDDPVVRTTTLYSEEAFGPDSVPLDIFRSEGYQVTLKRDSGRAKTNVSREAICRSGYFDAIPQSDMGKYPANAMGRLYLKFPGMGWGWCSGMQLADDLVLTAGHCAYSCESKKWVEGGGYFDGRYGNSYRAYSPIKSMATWTACDTSGTGFYDFALMRLGQPIKKSSYPVAYAPATNAFSASNKAYLYAYPAKTKSGNVPYLSFQNPATPNFVNGFPGRVELSLSSEQGSSGSPLFLGGLPKTFPWSNAVVGVTSYGYTNDQCPNGFAIFTEQYNPAELLKVLR